MAVFLPSKNSERPGCAYLPGAESQRRDTGKMRQRAQKSCQWLQIFASGFQRRSTIRCLLSLRKAGAASGRLNESTMLFDKWVRRRAIPPPRSYDEGRTHLVKTAASAPKHMATCNDVNFCKKAEISTASAIHGRLILA